MRDLRRFATICSTLATLSASLGTSGCATLVNGSTQRVSIVTLGPDRFEIAGARCTRSNDKGNWLVTSPAVVEVHRSRNAIVVDCEAADHLRGRQSAQASVGPIDYGSAFEGINFATGAIYSYPGRIVVFLGQVGPTTRQDGSNPAPPRPTPPQANGVAASGS